MNPSCSWLENPAVACPAASGLATSCQAVGAGSDGVVGRKLVMDDNLAEQPCQRLARHIALVVLL
jgi:hypothetical protein